MMKTKHLLTALLFSVSINASAVVVSEQAAATMAQNALKNPAVKPEAMVAGLKGTSMLQMWVWEPPVERGEGSWVVADQVYSYRPMIIQARLFPDPKVVGIPALLFVGAKGKNQHNQERYATLNGTQWEAFDGGLLPPHAIAVDGLNREYRVTLVNGQTPCDAIPGGAQIYAGYGLMTTENTKSVNSMISAGIRHTPDYLLQVFMSTDVQKNDRYWNVLNLSKCEKDTGHN